MKDLWRNGKEMLKNTAETVIELNSKRKSGEFDEGFATIPESRQVDDSPERKVFKIPGIKITWWRR